MKNKIIISLLVIIAILSLTFVYKSKSTESNLYPQEKTLTKSVLNPEETLKEFIDNEISRLNSYPIKKEPKYTKYASDRLLQKIEEIGEANKGELNPGGLPFNPYLGCAQDYPDNTSELSIDLIKQTSNLAILDVKLLSTYPKYTVHMINDNNAWKLDKIICENFEI